MKNTLVSITAIFIASILAAGGSRTSSQVIVSKPDSVPMLAHPVKSDSRAEKKIKENQFKSDSIQNETEELKRLNLKADRVLYQSIVLNRNADKAIRSAGIIEIPNPIPECYEIEMELPRVEIIKPVKKNWFRRTFFKN